jgi:hypothetical protein
LSCRSADRCDRFVNVSKSSLVAMLLGMEQTISRRWANLVDHWLT